MGIIRWKGEIQGRSSVRGNQKPISRRRLVAEFLSGFCAFSPISKLEFVDTETASFAEEGTNPILSHSQI